MMLPSIVKYEHGYKTEETIIFKGVQMRIVIQDTLMVHSGKVVQDYHIKSCTDTPDLNAALATGVLDIVKTYPAGGFAGLSIGEYITALGY